MTDSNNDDDGPPEERKVMKVTREFKENDKKIGSNIKRETASPEVKKKKVPGKNKS